MNDFINWLQGVDRSTVSSRNQESIATPDKATESKEKIAESIIEQTKPSKFLPRILSSALSDIDILQKAYGDLTPGMVITIPLHDACSLLGRTRHRVDAFKKLQDLLKLEYDVDLIITSRKTHGKNK